MAETSIGWTDATWNPVVGCARVSAGCKHCYAETMAARQVLMSRAQGRRSPYLPVVDEQRRRWNRRAVFLPERLAEPLSWRKPSRVFVNSMSDLFHEDITFEQVAAVFGVMAATPRHTYQVLTKRPERMVEFFEHVFGLEDTENTINREAIERGWVIWDGNAPRCGWPKNARPIDYAHLYAAAPNPATLCKRLPWVWPLPNVWLGVSVEDQRAADKRIPLLLQAPAVVRFISAEPLLGALELGALMGVPAGAEGEGADYYNALRGFGFFSDGEPAASRGERLDWVITGGESGPGARPMDPNWARSLRDQCEEAGVPFFFKQWGGPNKKKAGRVLDGRTHDAMPEVRRAA